MAQEYPKHIMFGHRSGVSSAACQDPGLGRGKVSSDQSHIYTSLSLSRPQIGSQGQLREQRETSCSGDLCQNLHFPLTLTSHKNV